MNELDELENRFNQVCFTLSEEDIQKLEERDNGPLNNVMSNISKECFGVYLFKEANEFVADIFYVTKPDRLQGDIISLKINDPDYFHLVFKFCHLLAVSYPEVDAIDAFNTFQTKLRGFLQKLGFTTVTSLELKQFEGKSITMMSSSPKGIKTVRLIDKVEFYRNYFNESYKIPKSDGKEYVYLMVNTDSSLIKIGFSNDPEYRERTLHSQEPSVHLIACWKTDKKKEKELHNKYKNKRVRGEWFRLNLTDLKELEDFMS